jgi:hypothetical protein
MAKDNKKWGTVKEAAYHALADLGETEARAEQFIHWALNGAKTFHIDQAKEVRTEILDLTAHKSIILPDSYVDWVKVGIKCGDTVKTFTHDTSIATHFDCVAGVKQENLPCYDEVDLFELDTSSDTHLFHNILATDFGVDIPVFGLAYKSNGLGYFTVHREVGEIQFRAIMPKNSKIYLEYISDGWDPNKETVINPLAFDLVVKYVHWQNKLFNVNAPRSHVAEMERLYWDEFDRVQYRLFDMTVEDVQEVFRQSFIATVQT